MPTACRHRAFCDSANLIEKSAGGRIGDLYRLSIGVGRIGGARQLSRPLYSKAAIPMRPPTALCAAGGRTFSRYPIATVSEVLRRPLRVDLGNRRFCFDVCWLLVHVTRFAFNQLEAVTGVGVR